MISVERWTRTCVIQLQGLKIGLIKVYEMHICSFSVAKMYGGGASLPSSGQAESQA